MKQIVRDEEFLRQKSDPVLDVIEAKEIIKELSETLSFCNGYGLSAIQIGIPKRVAIIKSNGKIYPIINPTVVEAIDEFTFDGEGCLSFPGRYVKSKRYQQFTIKNTIVDGNEFRDETVCFYLDRDAPKMTEKDYETIAVQHEIDHFDGKIIVNEGMDFFSGTISRNGEKIGRNDPCTCGSGKKYKKCCGK